MNVPQLRKAIIEQISPTRTVNGKPVYCLPNGNIISKAKRGDLESYLADLTLAQDAYHDKVTAEARHNELERLIARCNNRIRRYSKRRPLPNNFKLLTEWTAKRDEAVRQVGALRAEAA